MTEANGSGRAKKLRSSIHEATQRIDEIIEVAEQAAEGTRAEAQEEGERYLNRRREEADRVVQEHASALRELTNSIIQRSEQVAEGAEALAEELRTALPKLRALSNNRAARAGAPPSEDGETGDAQPRQSKQEQ